jgi:hypothetical protein
VASDGHSRALPDKAKSGPDQGEYLEAARRIEPLYRVLQKPDSEDEDLS